LTVREVVLKERVKSITPSVAVALWETDPLVAVTVMLYVPVGVDVLVKTVNAEEPVPFNVVALKLVGRLGETDAASCTIPVNPELEETLTVYAAFFPGFVEPELPPEKATEKSATTRVTVAV
jgi:hypothetical protein